MSYSPWNTNILRKADLIFMGGGDCCYAKIFLSQLMSLSHRPLVSNSHMICLSFEWSSRILKGERVSLVFFAIWLSCRERSGLEKILVPYSHNAQTEKNPSFLSKSTSFLSYLHFYRMIIPHWLHWNSLFLQSFHQKEITASCSASEELYYISILKRIPFKKGKC